ncbi:hypothetical protein [Treponema sp. C6A8]|nr:hypothetical protein [Treponema sp. C6A8]
MYTRSYREYKAGKCTNKELNYASRQMKSAGFRITWNKPEEDIKA